jgi:hypothetical protein
MYRVQGGIAMKTFLGQMLLLAVGVVLLTAGFYLRNRSFTSVNASLQSMCKQIAELASVKDYRQRNGYCYMVKDGKLTEVEL